MAAEERRTVDINHLFHGLDLGQLHLWKKANDVVFGWWRGTSKGFTTDAKTKSKPTEIDDPKINRFFMLRTFAEIVSEESDKLAEQPLLAPQ